MIINTQNIIKMLPFDEEFKNNLLGNWDTLSPDQKFNVEQIVWDAFAEVYELRFETNMRKALLAIRDKKESLDKNLYNRIKEKTDKELEELFEKEAPSANLAEARQELQEILNNPSNPSQNNNEKNQQGNA